MFRSWIVLFMTTTLSLALPASASEPVDAVIDKAQQDCRSFENGVFAMTDRAVSLVDLTGDGKAEKIIDARQFSCSSAASLFCGTGGCMLTVIAEGKPTEFLAKGWKVIQWDRQAILLLAVHGSACGGTNLRLCFKAVVWSEDGFRSLDGE